MGIFEDSFRRTFGFPTKKESLDHQIDNYRINELNSLNHTIASRNIDISYIEEQIRQIEKVISDNQIFIDNYELIKSNSIEKIKLGNSRLTRNIFDSKGNILASGNYSTLESYKASLIRRGASINQINEYVNALGNALESMWQEYANEIIIGEGFFKGGNSDADECYPIYSAYLSSLNRMNAGTLWDEKRISNKVRGINITLIIKTYTIAIKANGILNLLLQGLQNSLEILKSTQASDEYKKSVIEQTKKMLTTTSEYFGAKKSAEYFALIDSLKK